MHSNQSSTVWQAEFKKVVSRRSRAAVGAESRSAQVSVTYRPFSLVTHPSRLSCRARAYARVETTLRWWSSQGRPKEFRYIQQPQDQELGLPGAIVLVQSAQGSFDSALRMTAMEWGFPQPSVGSASYFLRLAARNSTVRFQASAASAGRYPALLLGFSKAWPASG